MTDQQQESPDDLLTFEEVQAKLRCSRTTVYDLVADGDLVMVKLRSRVRITRGSLAAYLARATVPGSKKGSGG